MSMSKDNLTKVTLTEEERAEFAISMRSLRKMYHASLDDIAKLTDIPGQSLSRYELGENAPSVFQAYKIAQCFGVTIEEMIREELTLPFPEHKNKTKDDEKK